MWQSKHVSGLLLAFVIALSVLLGMTVSDEAADVEKAKLIEEATKAERTGKLLSFFQLVEFPNDVCNGSDTDTFGTCYTSDECQDRGGQQSGTCASGYGVCCVFSKGCGTTSTENVTYFESTGNEQAGTCMTTICKGSDDICQFRLDFNTFSILGPSTSTVSVGQLINDNAMAYANRRVCDRDSFSVLSPGTTTPPVICGENRGEHMYVDAATDCITLSFVLDGASDPEWSIQVSQYSCDYSNLAPTGCTQYHFGESSGTVSTFNFRGGEHLASQKQKICIRREINECRICYSIDNPSDFQLSNSDTMTGIIGTSSMCCGYGLDGNVNSGYDCLIIPSASHFTTASMMNKVLSFSEFCGSSVTFKGSGFDAIVESKTICSKRTPFEVSFLSDPFEFVEDGMEALRSQAGFKLSYTQDSQC